MRPEKGAREGASHGETEQEEGDTNINKLAEAPGLSTTRGVYYALQKNIRT